MFATITAALGSVLMSFEQAEELKHEIGKWQTRAEAAHKQGNRDLVRSALKHKRRYKRLLAELKTDDPPFSALVPRYRPQSPSSSEIALPLPEPENEQKDDVSGP